MNDKNKSSFKDAMLKLNKSTNFWFVIGMILGFFITCICISFYYVFGCFDEYLSDDYRHSKEFYVSANALAPSYDMTFYDNMPSLDVVNANNLMYGVNSDRFFNMSTNRTYSNTIQTIESYYYLVTVRISDISLFTYDNLLFFNFGNDKLEFYLNIEDNYYNVIFRATSTGNVNYIFLPQGAVNGSLYFSDYQVYDLTTIYGGNIPSAIIDNPYLFTSYYRGFSDGNLIGYQDGYNTGYNSGYNQGNLEGYEEGYAEGYAEGYENGYDVGLEDGSTNGYEIGYEDGYAVGYNNGLDVFVADLKNTKSIYQIYHTNQVIPSNSGAVFNVSADGIGFYSTDNIYQTLELRLYFWLGNDLSLNFDLNLDIVNYLDTLTDVNLYLTPIAPMQNYGLYKVQEYEYDSNLTIEENNVALSQRFSLDGFSALERPFLMLQFIYDWAYPVNETIVTLNGSLSVYDSYATLIDNYRNEIETIYDNEIRYDSASYIAGVESGTQRGYEVGYSEGLIDGSGGINFGEFFFSIIDAPIQAVLNLFNFEIFGYNMRSFFLAIFSICLVVVVIRLILRMRS